MLNLGDKVSTIEVFLNEGTSLAEERRLVTQAVGSQGWVFDWFQANFGFFAAIQGQTNVLFIVLTMIVLVAAFNIVSSLVMLVRTKTADIAILRTMGATRGAILRLFLIDGLAIGGIGAAIGVALGLAFALNIEAIRQWLQHTFGLVLFDETLYLLAEMPCAHHLAGGRDHRRHGGGVRARGLALSRRRAPHGSIRWKGCAVSDAQIRRGERTVERWLAWRYLATRQREGFVSFIAIFSLIGVALGVATLIVVLSVMGGFRDQPDRPADRHERPYRDHRARRHAADHARAARGAAQGAGGQDRATDPRAAGAGQRQAARPAARCCAACGWRTCCRARSSRRTSSMASSATSTPGRAW